MGGASSNNNNDKGSNPNLNKGTVQFEANKTKTKENTILCIYDALMWNFRLWV